MCAYLFVYTHVLAEISANEMYGFLDHPYIQSTCITIHSDKTKSLQYLTLLSLHTMMGATL